MDMYDLRLLNEHFDQLYDFFGSSEAALKEIG